MRLLLAMTDVIRQEELRMLLYSRWEDWQIGCCVAAGDAQRMLAARWDLLVLQLGQRENRRIWQWLADSGIPCPPRVLLLAAPEECEGVCPDRTVPVTSTPAQLCRLVESLAKKPLSHLALQMRKRLECDVEAFLDALAMPRLKGRSYAAWLLVRLVPSPLGDDRPVGEWYRSCAGSFRTTPAAVERCLRVAVESVFTQGDLSAIERCFGATVDPEKGKPTNRAFLLKAAAYLRYSFTDTRSLNSSEMHHSPAAPTSV